MGHDQARKGTSGIDTVDLIFFHRYKPKEGDTVVELGAAAGSETGVLSELVGSSGSVLAVEPHPVTFQSLKRDYGECKNVRFIQAAVVGNPTGAARLVDIPNDWSNRVIKEGGIEVPSVGLDALTDGITKIDLLKVNIEGSEAEVLAASPKTLAKTENVVVSCHDFIDLVTKQDVRETLEAAGFDVVAHDQPLDKCIADYWYAKRL